MIHRANPLCFTALIVGVAGILVSPARATAPAVDYTWKNVTILAGGFIPGIVFSPAQRGLAYVRTDIGGFYRSNDAGQHWTPLTDWVGDEHGNWLGGESIAPDPTDPNTVYAAAGMYSGNPAAILRSHDQGKTWEATTVPFRMGGNEDGRGCGERLGVDPNDTHVLFFGSRHDGLWTSTDSAVSWRKVDGFPRLAGGAVGDWRHPGYGIAFVLFDPRSSVVGSACRILYAGVEQPGSVSALYRSSDAGKSWRPVPGLPDGLIAHHGAIDTDGSLYLTLGDKPGPNGVSVGAVIKLNTADGRWIDISPLKNSHGFGYAGLCLDHQHPGTLVVTTADRWSPGDDVFRSTDSGTTWKPIQPTQQIDPSLTPYLKWGKPQPREGWWIDAVAIDAFDSNHVMYGTGATIYGTHDIDNAMTGRPTHWTPEVAGIEETAAICLISPPAGPHLISGMGDVCGFVHDDFAVSPPQGMMTDPLSGNTDALDFAGRRPELVVRTTDKGPAISQDSGHTWNLLPGPFASGRGKSISVSADGSSIICGSRRGARMTHDLGRTWHLCNGLPSGSTVVADRLNSGTFYSLHNGTLLLSTNGGASFSESATGLPRSGKLVVNPFRTGDLWIAADGAGLLHGRPGNPFVRIPAVASAKLIAIGCPAAGSNADASAPPALFLAGRVSDQSSIFRSDDLGQSWSRIEDDNHQFGWLPDALAADPRTPGQVFLGTNGRGILYGTAAQGTP